MMSPCTLPKTVCGHAGNTQQTVPQTRCAGGIGMRLEPLRGGLMGRHGVGTPSGLLPGSSNVLHRVHLPALVVP